MSRCADGEHWFLAPAQGLPDDGQPCDCGEVRYDLDEALRLGDTVALLQELGLDPVVKLAEEETMADDEDDDLALRPGMYAGDGAAMAIIEQQRMAMLEHLRGARAVSITMVRERDRMEEGIHWGIYIDEDQEPLPFLLYAAVKAVEDLMEVLEVDCSEVCELIREVIEDVEGLSDT